MEAGVIGIVEENFDSLQSFTDTRRKNGFKLKRGLQIKRRYSDPDGRTIVAGRAAIEKVEEEEEVSFQDGEIIAREKPMKRGYYTNFVTVSGSFVIVSSGKGSFAFDLISEQVGTSIERAEIDLSNLTKNIDHANPWQIGFYNNSGLAKKGTVYGEELLNDSEIGEVFKRSENNQLGLLFSGVNGEEIQMTATESGYVEIYQPSSYDTEDFIQFLTEFIIPCISG